MGYQITVSIICLLLTVLYFLGFGLKYKVIPSSLSETSYIMGKYWFMGYCASLLLLMPPMFDLTPVNLQFCIFLMFGGLMMAGASPLFRETLEGKVHNISAIIAFVGFLIYACIELDWWLQLIYFGIVFALTKYRPQSFILFAEIMVVIILCILMLI